MKIRTSFVSNSSSSSFVVIFPKRPETIEELFNIMFKDRSKQEVVRYYDSSTTLLEIIKNVFLQLKGESASSEEISDTIKYNCEYLGGGVEHQDDSEIESYKKEVSYLNELYDEIQYPEYSKSNYCRKIVGVSKLNDNVINKILMCEHHIIWNKRDKIIKKIADIETKKFTKDITNDSFIAIFEFGDDSALGVVCEHGGIFDYSDLPYIVTIKH
jgi:hypothetical protein